LNTGTITATSLTLTTPLAIASGGTGTYSATGTGLVVLSTSPALTGTPTAPTALTTANDNQIATTAFVAAKVTGSTTPDADAITKGKLQLAGDLGGTAASPTVNSVGGVSSSTITTVASNVNSATSVNTANTIVRRDASGGFSTGTITGTLSGTASNANALTAGRTIGITGDITYTSPSFDGTGNVTGVGTLTNTGVTANTYGTSTGIPTITVDSKGRITSASTTNIPSATSSVTGLLSNTDYQTFSGKQSALTFGTGIESFLASPTSSNLSAAVTNDVGTGSLVFSNTPTLTNATLSGTLSLSAPLSVANGGTGTSTYTTGDILYASATNTLSKLGIGSAGQVLTVSSGIPSWGSNGITGVGTMTTTSYAEGATISGNSLILAPANATNGGVVTAGDQTFAGAKTFNSDIKTNGITVGRGNNATTVSNTAVGYLSLNANTSGIENVAFGYRTLLANTTGSGNLAFGQNALVNNQDGTANTAVGGAAMESNISGIQNTAVGSQALNSNKNSNNTAIGYYSLKLNNDGNNNTGVGTNAMKNNVSGSFNTAVGVSALLNTSGTYNTAIGFEARVLDGATTTNATAIGNGAIASASNTIQLGNTAVTSINTSGALTTGAVTYPIAHGTNGQVLTTTGSGTLTWTAPSTGGVTTISGGTTGLTPATATSGVVTLAGTLTATNGGTGQSTYATGDILYASAANTLSKLSKGSDGQVLTVSSGIPSWGSNGLYTLNTTSAASQIFTSTTSGTDFTISSGLGSGTLSNTAIHSFNIPNASLTARGLVSTGTQSFEGDKTFDNDIVSNFTYLGRGNSQNSGVGVANNLSIGVQAKNFSAAVTNGTTGDKNIAIGATTLTSLSTGTNNNAVGYFALKTNTTGYNNNAFGANTLTNNITGYNNTAIGEGALTLNNNSQTAGDGSDNTAVGYSSLTSNVSGYQNTAIGSTSGVTYNNLYNATAIGFGAKANTSNTIQLGNASVLTVVTSGTLSATGLRVTGGSPSTGKVLTSDASGNATWQAASAGISTVGTITTTANAAGATISGTILTLAAADQTNGGVLTAGTQTIGGNKTFSGTLSTTTVNATSLVLSGNLAGTSASFSKAVTGAAAGSFTGTTIDFTSSNLAYSTLNQANPIFALNGLNNGGTYTLAWQGTTGRGGSTSSFSSTGFTFKSLGNYPVVSGKDAIYTFVVMGTIVYYSMISEQ